MLHVFGQIVLPSSIYEIRAVNERCQSVLGENYWYSAPFVITTNKWGDEVSPFGVVNFQDISALVGKFQGDAGAISKTRAQLQPATPDPNVPVSFLDISKLVSAFQGSLYPYAAPPPCP